MCELDLEPCEVWSETPRRAAKEHVCGGCRQVIRKGDAYLSHFHVFEGEASTERLCFVCWWVRKLFARTHGYAAPSALYELIQDCIADGEDAWRDEMAVIKRRYRTSDARRKGLAGRWLEVRQ